MSKKKLSRTVIEGGRVGRNKWERRHSHRTVRANERAFMADVNKSEEAAYDSDVQPQEKVYKDFKDKLNPMYRWLHSQVGRVWNDVKSEVFQTFDTRTTAGRHITYDHLLSSVEEVPDLRYGRGRYYYGPEDRNTSYSPNDFYVDDAGILCVKKMVSRKSHKIPEFDTKQIANWLSGRVVGKVGNKYFWFIPADSNKKVHRANYTWKCDWGHRQYYRGSGFRFMYLSYHPIYKTDSVGAILVDDTGAKVVKEYEARWVAGEPFAFRQGRKLNEKEMAYWNTIPEYYQTKVLERSPTYPNPPKPDYRYGW